MNERIVCLDIGDVRIGVAVSDPAGIIASPVEVIKRIGWGPDTARIKAICDRYQTDRILSGLPLNMDGSEGFQAEKVRSFCAQLEKAGLNIIFHDERLSTVSAEEALIGSGVSRTDRKQVVDKIAAAVILQQWLDKKNMEASAMSDEMNRIPDENEPETDPNALTEGDIIELINEDGEAVPFIFVDALDYEGDIYLALADPEEDDAVFFLKIEQDEDGNDIYTAPDDSLEDALFIRFTSIRNSEEE